MIKIRNLVKDYQVNGVSFGAVNGLDLDIPDGEFFTLLGPSGCGKSTLLRCIAGLEIPTEGEIEVAGTTVFSSARRINVSPNKRRMGMVFQSYAIWPHMTVFGNVAFPLEVQKIRNKQQRVEQALTLVGLEQFGARMAFRLSGGQQQRVALARAIVADPKILLLDEPLSNLDAALRDQMRMELSRLHRTLGLTTVFVTHDQAEALSLSQSIAIMDAGKIVETGTPETLYRNPRRLFSAEFLGAANIHEGRGAMVGDGLFAIQTDFGLLHATSAPSQGLDANGNGIFSFFVRPESIHVRRHSSPTKQNEFAGKIVARSFMGHSVDLLVSLSDNSVMRCSCPGTEPIAVGDPVVISISPEDVGLANDNKRVGRAIAK